MRKLIIPTFIALLAVAPGAAFAATTAPTATGEQTMSGAVKFFSTSARSLELADGSWYYLPITFKAPPLKEGDKVTVHWKMDGSAHDVTAIDIG